MIVPSQAKSLWRHDDVCLLLLRFFLVFFVFYFISIYLVSAFFLFKIYEKKKRIIVLAYRIFPFNKNWSFFLRFLFSYWIIVKFISSATNCKWKWKAKQKIKLVFPIKNFGTKCNSSEKWYFMFSHFLNLKIYFDAHSILISRSRSKKHRAVKVNRP